MTVSMSLLGCVLMAATVGVQVEEARDVAPKVRQAMIEELTRSLSEKGYDVIIEPSKQAVDEQLVLHIVAALTVMRVRVARQGPDGLGRGEVETDRPIDAWSGAMTAAVEQLFPHAAVANTAELSVAAPSHRSAWPWVLVGTGVAALGAAAGLAIVGGSTRSNVTSGELYDPSGAAMLQTADTQTTVSIGLLVGGAVVLSTGILIAFLAD